MANNKLLINERQADVGNFMVGRLLPFRKKRQVGPFTFIDHMGPAKLENGNYVDVDQHPHIGLSTLTYLFEGSIEHRDSIGTVQVINPGDVGFMTAGSGVTHTERTPDEQRNGHEIVMHGYQIWVALPKDKEEIEPQFEYYSSQNLPQWNLGALRIKLVAGNAFGKSSPLQGFSPLFMVDIFAEESSEINLRGQLKGEVAFVIVRGAIKSQNDIAEAGQMLVSKSNEECEVVLEKGTQLLLFGGEPLKEAHYLLWNFVSHSKERLHKAKEDWKNRCFPKVLNDNTYIPFPEL